MKFRTIFNIISVLSILASVYFFNAWLNQKKENTRLNNNFSVLASEIRAENKNQVQILEMTVKEIKQSFPELEKKLKHDFDVKLKNLVQYSHINTEVNHTFKAPVKSEIWWKGFSKTADSVINAITAKASEGVPVDTIKLKTFSYKDKWLDFNALEIDDTVYVDRNKMPVPLDQVIHKDKWKFKYIFKKRPLIQYVKSENPYAEIKFNRVIQVR